MASDNDTGQRQRIIQELRGDFAPYAAVNNVMEVITRRRGRGLPNPLTTKALESISIPPGNISRTLQAIRFLGLMEYDGSQTELFDRLARAGGQDGEYREILGEVIKNAYHAVFAIVDPAQDGDVAIHDAFRQFVPEAQRERMVSFFLGMCGRAGITAPRSIERREASRSQSASQGRRGAAPQTKQQRPQQQEAAQRHTPDSDGDNRLVFAVMQQLPTNLRWSSDRRQKWLAVIQSAVDLMVEVVDDRQVEQNGEAQ